MRGNISRQHLMSYQTGEEKLASVYVTKKVDRKTEGRRVTLCP
jgi:hypothetical protein